MKPRNRLLTCLALLLSLSAVRASDSTVIHAGTLLAVPGETPRKEMTLVISGGKIAAVHEGYRSPADLEIEVAEVIDLKQAFVLPGLMDMHTHITGERDPDANPHRWTTMEDGDFVLEALPYLERTLMAGFTTVRNLGAPADVIAPLRSGVEKGLIPGPRIVAATGAVSATGGHGDFHGYRQEILDLYPPTGICNGADDCRRAVRALVKQGADVIKITATGGVLSNTAAGVGQQLTDEELAAIVDAAHALGRKVAAHAHGADGINAALRAGVDSIEHGTYTDGESVKLYRKSGAYLVPTLLAGTSVVEEAEVNDQIPPAIRAKIAQIGPQMKSGFQRALKGGVKIAFGTDSGVSRHGENAREFELMVEAGMEPAAAIRSATVDAADLLGRSAQLGTIEVGKLADIIAVDGDPIENISELRDVDFVMKSGTVYKTP